MSSAGKGGDADAPGGQELASRLAAVEGATAVVRERWKPAILWLIAADHRRFSELQRALPHVTHKMLSQQLQDLVRDGILTRWSAARGRRHVEYALTPAGEALRPLLGALEVWGHAHAPSHALAHVHGHAPATAPAGAQARSHAHSHGPANAHVAAHVAAHAERGPSAARSGPVPATDRR